MKKCIVLFMMVLLIVGLCFSQQVSKKVYTVKIGHVMSVDSIRQKALLDFKKYVEEKSNGQIKVEIYPGSQLGNEADMIEAMKMGTLEGFVGGVFDSQTPKLNLILMPFFFENQEDLMKVAHSEIGTMIMKSAEAYGIKMLAFGDGGSREFTNNVRPIRTPADMKGLKIRAPAIESIIQTLNALGANVVSIPLGDAYMALKTGVADGQENPLPTIGDSKFYEVQKYMTLIDYQFHPEPIDVGLAWYNKLPSELQKVLQDGAWLYVDSQNALRKELNDYYYKMIVDAGVQVYKPTSAEREMFVKACQPVYDYFINKGTFTKADLDAMRKIIASK